MPAPVLRESGPTRGMLTVTRACHCGEEHRGRRGQDRHGKRAQGGVRQARQEGAAEEGAPEAQNPKGMSQSRSASQQLYSISILLVRSFICEATEVACTTLCLDKSGKGHT